MTQPWEPMAWLAAVAVLLVPAVTMWWSDGITGAWLGLVGVVAYVALATRYGIWVGLLPVIACLPPALFLILAWQRLRTRRALLTFVVGLLLLVTAGGVAAWAAHESVYGATHPASATPSPPPSPVLWMWSGAVTTDGFTVVAGMRTAGAVDLDVWGEGIGVITTVPGWATGDPAVVRFEVADLAAGAPYHYVVSTADGDGPVGRVRTFPSGPADLTIAFSSCARIGSNGSVFDAIAALDPDLYVITGDWFYGDIGPDDPEAFLDAYRVTLTRPAQSALYRSVPIAYVWDDHDFGMNDADRSAPSRPAAMSVYRSLVPHYPLSGDDSPIHQAFTVGRVRVVMTDTRSARSAASVLGDEQTGWFEDQVRAAAAAGELVLWVNSDPWIAPADPGADHWGGFPEQRTALARVIADSGVDLVMLGGDAHMVAIDDGTNNTYAGGPGFVVFHAGALDRPGSVKGGPYSEGAVAGGGQFGIVDIEDDGSTMFVILRGLDWQGTVVGEYSFTVGGG